MQRRRAPSVVVVSRYDPTPPRALVLYVPVTMQNRSSAYEIELPTLRFLRQSSVVNLQGLGSIPAARLERKLGELPNETLLKIKQALIFALDLEIEEEQDDSRDVNSTL